MSQKCSALFLAFILITIIISGCSSNHESNQAIDLEYFKKTAKIGMTEVEMQEAFGQEPISDHVDNSDVWLFDRTKPEYKYKPDLNKVENDAIKKGDIEYQLFIILKEKQAIMYSYFYRGENNEVWQYVLNPDGTILNNQVSN